MTFRDQFSASQEKAYNRSIGTKIFDGMFNLRASVDSSSTTRKRWIWELIQNAKDVSIKGKVRVRIDAELMGEHAHVTFRHNGRAFSAENIRFLIEQISSKDRTADDSGRPTTTGKFGTGFLTTHLLSERVVVRGVAKGPGFLPRKFKLPLDRSGADLEEIIDAVQTAKDSVQDLDDQSPYAAYVPGEFNTSFRYELGDLTSKTVARDGLADLDICLPYTLAFVPEIESVEYLNRQWSLQEPAAEISDEVQIISVEIADTEESADTEIFSIAILTNDLTTIAVPVKQKASGVQLLPVPPDVPRLFCDFPLLGAETFPFPVIINNPTFNPTEPRDGVFLNKTGRPSPQIDHNKSIIEEALVLYLRMLVLAAGKGWQNLHLFAAVKPFPAELARLDQDWYKTAILKPLRDTLLRTDIVRTAAGEMASIHSAKGSYNIWFPSNSSKDVRRAIWHCCNTWIPSQLPALSDLEIWHEIIWQECGKMTLDKVAESIEAYGTIEQLEDDLEGVEVHVWLLNFYACLKLDEIGFQAIVNKRRIFPNQNGTFKRKAEMSRDAGDINPDLLDILSLLGNDLRDQLLDKEIDTELEDLAQRDEAFVVKEINAKIEKNLNDRSATKRFRPALDKLLLWFRESPSRARKLFPILFEQKHLLYDDEEILNNIVRAEELSELLHEFNVKNVSELRAVIVKNTPTSTLLPVTQQIIASLGITSVDEWRKAIEDRDLVAIFSHESTPTSDMFVYAQSLIKKAKERVIAYLNGLEEYDLSEMDETAPTVLAGIKKDQRDVTVVVRPAYDGTVIIYYQSERDVLDFVDHELWVDTGNDVRRITFGHILKKTNIRRFPI